jgi:hypothetical protein
MVLKVDVEVRGLWFVTAHTGSVLTEASNEVIEVLVTSVLDVDASKHLSCS